MVLSTLEQLLVRMQQDATTEGKSCEIALREARAVFGRPMYKATPDDLRCMAAFYSHLYGVHSRRSMPLDVVILICAD